MRLIVAILAALVTYVFSMIVLTGVLTSMFSAVWWIVYQDWVWVWEFNATPGMIIMLLCIGIANFLIEDYIRCQCNSYEKPHRG